MKFPKEKYHTVLKSYQEHCQFLGKSESEVQARQWFKGFMESKFDILDICKGLEISARESKTGTAFPRFADIKKVVERIEQSKRRETKTIFRINDWRSTEISNELPLLEQLISFENMIFYFLVFKKVSPWTEENWSCHTNLRQARTKADKDRFLKACRDYFLFLESFQNWVFEHHFNLATDVNLSTTIACALDFNSPHDRFVKTGYNKALMEEMIPEAKRTRKGREELRAKRKKFYELSLTYKIHCSNYSIPDKEEKNYLTSVKGMADRSFKAVQV